MAIISPPSAGRDNLYIDHYRDDYAYDSDPQNMISSETMRQIRLMREREALQARSFAQQNRDLISPSAYDMAMRTGLTTLSTSTGNGQIYISDGDITRGYESADMIQPKQKHKKHYSSFEKELQAEVDSWLKDVA